MQFCPCDYVTCLLQGFSYLSEVGARALLNLGKKSIWTIKSGKLELDCHFKGLKNIKEIISIKLLQLPTIKICNLSDFHEIFTKM